MNRLLNFGPTLGELLLNIGLYNLEGKGVIGQIVRHIGARNTGDKRLKLFVRTFRSLVILKKMYHHKVNWHCTFVRTQL